MLQSVNRNHVGLHRKNKNSLVFDSRFSLLMAFE